MTPRTAARLLAALIFLLTLAAPAAAEVAGEVTRVYDGDTLRVAGVGKVRLLGIDCPEMESSGRDRFYLRKGIEEEALRRTARRARTFTRQKALGRPVTLRFDRDRTDRHGRTLAYVILPDGRMLNRLLLEEGLAAVYRRFDFRLKEPFFAAEREARAAGRGIWRRQKGAGDIETERGLAILSRSEAQ